MIPCPHNDCDGHLELAARVYLDVDDATVTDWPPDPDDRTPTVALRAVSFSHLNDELHGHPIDLEGDSLDLTCTEGHHFDWEIATELRARIAPQPIGDAPRTLGRRGGS